MARVLEVADLMKDVEAGQARIPGMLTLGGRGGESFWEGGDDFGVEVLRFHTCLTDILGFLEKLEWWFEQDIDKEEERFEGDEDGGEV
ncbi:hypothetical protein Tco_0713337 [Tanacetum coccineum]